MSWESRIRTCEDLQEVRFVYDNPRLSKLALFSSVSPKCTVGGWDTPTHAHKRKGALSITFSMPKPNLSWEGTNTLSDKVLSPHNWTLSPPLLGEQDSNLRRPLRGRICVRQSPLILSLRLILRHLPNSWVGRIRTCEDFVEVRHAYRGPRLTMLALFGTTQMSWVGRIRTCEDLLEVGIVYHIPRLSLNSPWHWQEPCQRQENLSLRFSSAPLKWFIFKSALWVWNNIECHSFTVKDCWRNSKCLYPISKRIWDCFIYDFLLHLFFVLLLNLLLLAVLLRSNTANIQKKIQRWKFLEKNFLF